MTYIWATLVLHLLTRLREYFSTGVLVRREYGSFPTSHLHGEPDDDESFDGHEGDVPGRARDHGTLYVICYSTRDVVREDREPPPVERYVVYKQLGEHHHQVCHSQEHQYDARRLAYRDIECQQLVWTISRS